MFSTRGDQMKALSLRVEHEAFERGLTAAMRPGGVWIRHTEPSVLLDRHEDHELSFAGATVERFDEGRSLGGAALGAVAGGVLTGGLGVIAGAALGGRKKHSIVLRHDDASAVLVLTTAELQTVVARCGVLGQQCAGKQARTKKLSSSLTFASVVLLAVIAIFVLAAFVRK
jgi:hypothetical protein